MDIDFALLKSLLIPAGVAIATAAAVLMARSLFFKVLRGWARRTESHADDVVIEVLRAPSIYWALAIGIYVGVGVSELPDRYVFYLTKAIHVLIVLSVTVAGANLTGKIFTSYVQRLSLPLPTTGLAHGVVKGSIILVGVLVILSMLGVAITPLITALGVGGLAVALALQDTLANLFAGLHILMEKSIRVGDFIKLETGEQGYVDDITWRTTRIRMVLNNMVVIPNSKLSQSIVTNFHLPEKQMSLRIPVGVAYSSNPEHVSRVLQEEAEKAIGEVPGLLGPPEAAAPLVRFMDFGDSSLDFVLILRIREFIDQYPVQTELRKRIFKRFEEEGIEIPFPHRTVYFREEKDWQKEPK